MAGATKSHAGIRPRIALAAFSLAFSAWPYSTSAQEESDPSEKKGGRRSQCAATSIEVRREIEGATVQQALQGRIPGVTVIENGSSAAINIRGFRSTRGGGPLIYIDGLRVRQAEEMGLRGMHRLPLLEFVNPFDIDRIEVLRGAAATIQYGMDAVDGVILIFTKRAGFSDSTASDSSTVCGDSGFGESLPGAESDRSRA